MQARLERSGVPEQAVGTPSGPTAHLVQSESMWGYSHDPLLDKLEHAGIPESLWPQVDRLYRAYVSNESSLPHPPVTR